MKLVEFTTTKTGNSKDQVKVQLLVQVNYKDLLVKDIARLRSLSFDDAKKICLDKGINFNDQDLQDSMYGTAPSRKGLVTGMEQSLNGSNPDSTESLYTKHPQYNFIKVKTSNNENYITGLIVSETVLVKDQNPEPYKAYNSGPVVLCKNAIKKALNLETEKFRTYRIDNLTQFEGSI
jgi:hypothetical protein